MFHNYNRRCIRCLTCALVATLFCTAALALDTQLTSRPVGFVRVELPIGTNVLTSIPYWPFASSIHGVLGEQLKPGTGEQSRITVMAWDTAKQEYIFAEKLQGADEEVDGKWWKDVEKRELSELELWPGDAFFIRNEGSRIRNLYLWGDVVLERERTITLSPGMNFLGYPFSVARKLDGCALVTNASPADLLAAYEQGTYWYPVTSADSAMIRWQSADGAVNGSWEATLQMGRGYAFQRAGNDALVWSEERPYGDTVPAPGLPAVISMSVNSGDNELYLTIACDNIRGQQIDIFYKNAVATNTQLDVESFWQLAAGNVSVPYVPPDPEEICESRRVPVMRWADSGYGRGKVDTVDVRYYLIARADIDTDNDGIPDARERFIMGTDPLRADSDGDGMPDRWEIENGLNARADDSASDFDKDGRSNLEEYNAGTRPQYARENSITIYVDQETGNDAYSGLLASVAADEGPLKTISAALRAAIPGDRIVVKEGGVYYEDISIPKGVNMSVLGSTYIGRRPEEEKK